MNSLKSQSYSLSPDQYLQRFKNPNSIISDKLIEVTAEQRNIMNYFLSFFSDTEEQVLMKKKIIDQMTSIIKKWMEDVIKQQSLKQQQKNKEVIQKQIKKQVISNREQQNDTTPQLDSCSMEDPPLLQDFQKIGYGLKVFGSFKMNTNSSDGDIDMLCIVPQYFSREKHFFKNLVQNLQKQSNFKDIFSIPDAIVPLIRLNANGVQIDLLLSRIKQNSLRLHFNWFNPHSQQFLNNFQIHDRQIRCMNGYRTALYLNHFYVQKYSNYKDTLKLIKLWARLRGVYSQIYGYLGGAAFSIMLAKICQLYPNYSFANLLDRFFFIYSHWVWSIPIMIQKIQYIQKLQSEMIVFTPLEPHMNASHYISKITSNVTKKQLRQASKIIQQINKGQQKWQKFFTPFNFFKQFNNFIQIAVMGKQSNDFMPWRGTVESKIRKFIQFIEQQPQIMNEVQVHPYPKQFNSTHKKYKYCSRYYIGIKCHSNTHLSDGVQIDFTNVVKNFVNILQKYQQFKKVPQLINISFAHISENQIPLDVKQCFQQFIDKSPK